MCAMSLARSSPVRLRSIISPPPAYRSVKRNSRSEDGAGAEVSRNHPENVCTAAEQRRRLHRAESGGRGDLPVRCKLFVNLHVLDDDARARLQRTPADALEWATSAKYSRNCGLNPRCATISSTFDSGL